MDILYFFHIHFTNFHIQIFPKYPSICNLYIIVLNNSSKYISTILRTFGSWYFTQRLSISQASFLSKGFPRIHHVLRISSLLSSNYVIFFGKKTFARCCSQLTVMFQPNLADRALLFAWITRSTESSLADCWISWLFSLQVSLGRGRTDERTNADWSRPIAFGDTGSSAVPFAPNTNRSCYLHL